MDALLRIKANECEYKERKTIHNGIDDDDMITEII